MQKQPLPGFHFFNKKKKFGRNGKKVIKPHYFQIIEQSNRLWQGNPQLPMKVGTADFLRKQIILYKPLQKSETVETLLHSFPIDIPDAIEPR